MQLITSKEGLLNNPIHNFSFLDWVQAQTEFISEFSNIITRLEDESQREVVSMAMVNKCMAQYSKFFAIQTAFYQIYKKKHQDLEKEAGTLFDKIYYAIKLRATDKEDEIGKRYIKKGATQEEIKREAAVHHPDWLPYADLLTRISEFDLKMRAQLRNLKIVEKMDINLQSLKKVTEKEIKYLYLE